MRGKATIAAGAFVVLLLVLLVRQSVQHDPLLPPERPGLSARAPEQPAMPPALPDDPRPGIAPEEVVLPPDESATSPSQPDQAGAAESPRPDIRIRIGLGRIEAAPVFRELTREMIPVPPGRAPSIRAGALLRGGITSVHGTVELAADRDPEVEQGLPVGIAGRVVEKETGLPVPDAEVVLRSAFYVRAIFYDHHLREVARAVTDADGEFRVERLNVDPVHFGSDGRVYLSVVSPDHAPHPAIPLVSVSAGYQNRLADVRLSRERCTLRGRVIDLWEGKPVVGGRVVATGEIDPIRYPKDQREALFLSSPETVTDQEGRFVLENVGPGPQMLSVHGGDDCAGYLMVQAPRADEITLRVRQIRGHIAGQVIDEWGEPIALVKVDGGENTTHTFADGSFVLENFRGDVIPVHFEHTEFRSLTLTGIEDGSEGLVVRMESRLPLLRFDVRDAATGQPIKAIQLVIRYTDGAAPVAPASPHHLSEEGVHAVRIPPGAQIAIIEATGYQPAQVDLKGRLDGDTVPVSLVR